MDVVTDMTHTSVGVQYKKFARAGSEKALANEVCAVCDILTNKIQSLYVSANCTILIFYNFIV